MQYSQPLVLRLGSCVLPRAPAVVPVELRSSHARVRNVSSAFVRLTPAPSMRVVVQRLKGALVVVPCLVFQCRKYYCMFLLAAGTPAPWFTDGLIDGHRERSWPTSLLPLPNPCMTFPFSRRGKGASGPLSGPTTVGRGPSGRGMGVPTPF
jgi:hypothetical protein